MFINIKNFEEYFSPAISSQHLHSFCSDNEMLQVQSNRSLLQYNTNSAIYTAIYAIFRQHIFPFQI